MIDVLVTGQSLIAAPLAPAPAPGWDALRDLLQNSDVAFTNFEGTIAPDSGGWPSKDKTLHVAPPSVLDSLRDTGFNALSLANNHAFDLGPAGIEATIAAAAARGFLQAGAGRDLDQATGPVVATLGGRRVALVAMDAGPQPAQVYARNPDERAGARPGINRLGLISSVAVPAADFARAQDLVAACGHDRRIAARVAAGYQPPTPPGLLDFFGTYLEAGEPPREERRPVAADLTRNLEAIARARAEAELVIVYLHQHHWAPDWRQAPAWIKPLARQMIEAGADIFVSHGAPTLHGMELYRGKPIFWGLGCFVFDTGKPERYGEAHYWEGLVARCRFDGPDAVCTLTLYPIGVGRTRAGRSPSLLGGDRGRALVERVLAASSLPSHAVEPCDGGFRLAPAASAG